MKKNKILAGISALVMGATMMAGTAMSASAADIYNSTGTTVIIADEKAADGTPVHGGGFYYADVDSFDDITSSTTWTYAPMGMYDGEIDKAKQNSSTSYTLDLKALSVYGISGTISSLVDEDGTEYVSNSTATIAPDTPYYLTVSIPAIFTTIHRHYYVEFKVLA